ncbi:dihydrolipoyllysine-residue (2-methylpropanoyl)transferase [Ranunculus cassubicifolius]
MSWKQITRIHITSRAKHSTPLLPPLIPTKSLHQQQQKKSSQLIASRSVSYSVNGFDWKKINGMRRCYYSVDPSLGEIVEVPLAQTGEGIAECELLKWFVQEGDQVEEFQPLCEVQSDKATIEITSRYKGRVADILYGSGDIVKVGETLLKMVVDGTQCSTLPSDTVSLTPDSCDTNIQSSLFFEQTVGNNLATPAVRNMAKQFGINITDVHGSSKDGRVSKEDLLNYAVSRGLCPQPSAALAEQLLIEEEKSLRDGWNFEDKTVPVRGFQRAMVKSMTMAAKVPHFHYLEEINCDALVKLKSVFQNNNSDPDIKHTYLPFLVKALSMALSKHPLLNSSFSEESNEITLKGNHNIGVAMATPNGLVVPNVKKVQSLSILEITKELARLQQLAFANKLTSEDISGGTITLSNIGAVGGKFGTPLLNLPEVAIIAIGRFQKVPRFDDDGGVYPASIANVNIGADHRVVDGASVARFCNDWKLLIEKPDLLLLQTR